jgi:hypothetical protein
MISSDFGIALHDELTPAGEILRLALALAMSFEFFEFVARKNLGNSSGIIVTCFMA